MADDGIEPKDVVTPVASKKPPVDDDPVPQVDLTKAC